MTRSTIHPWSVWLVWAMGWPLTLLGLGFAVVASTEPEEVVFDNPQWWWLGAAGPFAGAVVLYGVWQRRRSLERFTSPELSTLLAQRVHPSRQAFRSGLLIAAVLMVVAAVIGPRWGMYLEKQKAYGVDVVVAIDVSRSMLADDVTPNRLERAKREIREQLVERAVFHHANRFALLAFAGSTSLKLPLTTDYLAFRNKLEMIRVGSAPRGGTAIGQAIRKATDLFARSPQEATKLLLVFTDGEDHEGEPIEAAKEAFEQHGIRVFTIGVGDPARTVGAQLMVGEGREAKPLLHDGQIVFSKLDVDGMRKIAEAGSGRYAPITEFRHLVDAIVGMRKVQLSTEERVRHRPQYQWFAAAALLLLAIETIVREVRRTDAPKLRRVWQLEATR